MSKNGFNGENLEYFSLLTIRLRWAFSVYGLTPELGRAAKRRRLECGYLSPRPLTSLHGVQANHVAFGVGN